MVTIDSSSEEEDEESESEDEDKVSVFTSALITKLLARKRKHYKCGDKFITIDMIPLLKDVQHNCKKFSEPIFKPNEKINSKISLIQ